MQLKFMEGTGPCSVEKKATRGVQNQGQGYRGVAG